MTQKEILEGNKLIAYFDGWEHSGKGGNLSNYYYRGNQQIHSNDFQYLSSWDWLMFAIEKIEGLGMEFNIKNNIVTVNGTLLEHPTTKHPISVEFDWRGSIKTDTKFNSCYWAVKTFVKWYNQVKNN